MKTYRLEKNLRQDIVKALCIQEDCLAWANHENMHTHRGSADVTGICKGRGFAFELKLIGNSKGVSPIQDKWLQSFADAGGFCGSLTYYPGDNYLEFRRWTPPGLNRFILTTMSIPLTEGMASSMKSLLMAMRAHE